MTNPAPPHDPFASLRSATFRQYLFGRFAATLGYQMVATAISWELYERTGDPLALGTVGLVKVIPVILLSLNAGQIIDRYNRKTIAQLSQIALVLCSILLAILSAVQGPVLAIYGVLLITGIASAFSNPALSAIMPQYVPEKDFPNAATWASNSWQGATIFGPALAGLLIFFAKGATAVFWVDVVLGLLAFAMTITLPYKHPINATTKMTRESLFAGVRFVMDTPLILATITMDMLAVLLGGATALMPIFAKDILKVGADGLGILNAAPAVGALVMSTAIAFLPPFKRAGLILCSAVVGFGIATIVFGLSTSLGVSLLALFVLGALDQVSVVVRQSLVLIHTPDELRGRMNAINSIFIGTSNQMGEFESGFLASLIGPIPTVVIGGIGTVVVVLIIAAAVPELRKLGSLSERISKRSDKRPVIPQ